jgi:phosphoserine phosphatase
MDERVSGFWSTHKTYLQAFYMNQKRIDDVIISASPTFLLQPLIDEWGCILIASVVDQKTGHTEENCYGPEKVKRFSQSYPLDSIDEFYSDSLSDTPLALHAKEAFFVTGKKKKKWPKQ